MLKDFTAEFYYDLEDGSVVARVAYLSSRYLHIKFYLFDEYVQGYFDEPLYFYSTKNKVLINFDIALEYLLN
jgi:hypothetical protein